MLSVLLVLYYYDSKLYSGAAIGCAYAEHMPSLAAGNDSAAQSAAHQTL
jgi:hypothetical protein